MANDSAILVEKSIIDQIISCTLEALAQHQDFDSGILERLRVLYASGELERDAKLLDVLGGANN